MTYPTFTRIANSNSMWSPVVNAAFDQFNWTNNIVIVKGVEDVFIPSTNALVREMVQGGKTVTMRVLRSTIKGSELDYEVNMEDWY